MRLPLAFTLIAALLMASCSTAVNREASAPIVEVNYRALVSSADVHHTGIVTTSRYGMPMGTLCGAIVTIH